MPKPKLLDRHARKIFVLAAGLALISLTTAPTPVLSQASPKALFEQRCSLCHKSSRASDQKKTPDAWRETVTRMQKNSGGKISAEDSAIIIKYLSEANAAK